MKPLKSALLVAALTLSCATRQPLPGESGPAIDERPSAITAVGFSKNGDKLLVARQAGSGCEIESLVPGGTATDIAHAERCPSRIGELTDDHLFLGWSGGGEVLGDAGATNVLDAAGDLKLVRRGDNVVVLSPAGEKIIGNATGIQSARVLPLSGAVVAVRFDMTGQRLVRLDVPVNLSEPVEEIESWDFSPDEKEVVFSARRKGDYDVAIANLAGDKVRWLPSDPKPEIHVSWAPRGHKVSYVIERDEGSFIRTVHLPTGFQLTVPFASSSIDAIAWEPKAERFAVIVSAPQFSPRVDWLKYGGEQRQQLVASKEFVQAEVDSLSWNGGTAVLTRPSSVRYSAKTPLVVWIGVDHSLGWSPARAALQNAAEVGQIVVPSGSGASPEFWNEVMKLPWIDAARISVVVVSPQPASTLRAIPPAANVFLSNEDAPAAAGIVPLKRLRRLGVSRSDVESAAAREIATYLGSPQKTDGRN